MTQDEIIEIAEQAGCFEKHQVFYFTLPELKVFAELAAVKAFPDGVDAEWIARRTKYAVEQEREACAKVCEQRSDPLGYANLKAEACAKAIRARGEA